MNTGTFAKMCGVEKRTLFHYDDIDLLKPVLVRENGYREYSVEQLGMMDMIKIFQTCGYSLSEIRQICGAETDAKLRYAEDAINRIDAKIDQLRQMKRYLRSKERLLEEYRALPVGGHSIQNTAIRYDRKAVKGEAHFFSFLRDGIYSVILLDESDEIWLCKYSEDGAHLNVGTAISFFMEIPSESPDLNAQIRQKLENFQFIGRYPYFVESLPHFLLKDQGNAVIKVTVMQAE